MAEYTKTLPGNINRQLFAQEIRSAGGALVGSIEIRGFERETGGATESIRFSAPTVVGRTKDGSGVTEDTAQPGEVRINTTQDLTTPQEAALDAAILAHDPTSLTNEQQDQADVQSQLVAVFDDLRAVNFNALTAAQKAEALRRALIFVGKKVYNLSLRAND